MAALDAAARRPMVAYTAKRRLEGELLDKNERAWMDVITRFDPARGISHEVVGQGGSDRIRSKALEKVLQKEREVIREDEARRAAFSSDNYRYRLMDSAWAPAQVELVPLRSESRLLKGVAFVDPDDGALLKVEGRLADNPSFWVRDVKVTRVYARVGENTLPVEIESTARVRMFGTARLHIRNEYLTVDGQAVRQAAAPALALALPR